MHNDQTHSDNSGALLDLDLLDRHAGDLFARATQIIDDSAVGVAGLHHVGDDEGMAITAAVVLASHLRVVMGLTVSDEDRRDVVVDLTETARDCQVASHAAIGAMSLLADAAVRLDVDEFGSLLFEALDVIDASDLFEAAASLLTAMALIIGDRIGLEPDVVIAEMGSAAERRALAAELAERGAVCGSSHRQPRAISSGRGQTCPGRNSQCQGSLGTASTQPKRGPFVFIH